MPVHRSFRDEHAMNGSVRLTTSDDARSTTAQRAPRGTLRVLLVEDDPAVLQTIKTMLGLIGCEVLVAGGAKEAIAIPHASPVDLLLTVLKLGPDRGPDVIAALRGRQPKAAIIAMSGDPEEDGLGSLALRLGASSVLRKPFTRKSLARAIDQGVAVRK